MWKNAWKAMVAASSSVIVHDVLCEKAGNRRKDLPTFSKSQVEQHKQVGDTWVIYQNGVYDVSAFMSQHPGGMDKLKLAAGGSIEPYWQVYAAHHHKEVYGILESLRIGNLDEADVVPKKVKGDGPYGEDPIRHSSLKVNADKPFNAEPPVELLLSSYITPNALFFVRNHLPVPVVENIKDFRLVIEGVGEGVAFSMEELRNEFPIHHVTSTIQCAGNRRMEMSNVKPVKGLSWGVAAIGTATWTGVKLADVLAKCGNGMDEDGDHEDRQHVQFEGLDKGVDGAGYGASIPIANATDPRKDVLLAFEMNGQDIPRDHGYPLRVIVPGTVGARNVKFLHKIRISKEESTSFWQRKDYKGFPPNVDYNTKNFEQVAGPSIQELPVQSAIIEPKHGACLEDDMLTVKGYAWSGGGRGIIRVDVSIDGGRNWLQAELDPIALEQKQNRAWAWTPWEITFDVSDEHHLDELDIRCKAVDNSYNCQPDTISPIWNMRGVLNNAWHQIKVVVKKQP